MSRPRPKHTFRLAALAGAVAALLAAGPAQAQQMRGPQGPTEVGVMPVTRSDVPVTVELPGRAVAYQLAAIRPKVGGEITEIPYQPGTEVEAGTVLFRLEDESLEAALAAEEVAVTSAEAALEWARDTVERYRKLSGSGVSLTDVRSAVVSLAQAEAALGASKSRLQLARLALERTEITSPIPGIVAVTPFSVGDIVSANQAEQLTEVAQVDPIYVDVSESRARILRHQQSINAGSMQRPGAPIDARLTLETGEVYGQPGRVLSPGSAVSATTGTIPIRLQFPNPDRMILPGQFVRVTLTIGQIDAILVPQRATSRSAAGQLTAFVAQDGRAVQVRLTEQGTHDNAWIVTDGLVEGDPLILDGLDNLRDGAEITTVPVTIDAEGVVRDATPTAQPTQEDAAAPSARRDAPQPGVTSTAAAAAPANTVSN
ncbi:efflux RND transporter periplasmic adaptor subunit [Paracoccus xiamenensis]|uniref:efflux RND transporter periplasmic adaptor subunit n=1 Tax=Paracoccus xiamenensis TaxID=2714901 RepID=UPI001409A647|nr:efflux RND transporter periplasmic adaptor subunit [Paracoccus xiamenensis]NHF72763.1 efflux RND transporter periplasmic adaptor subunit [Paracoccus xiamenensis]